MIKNITEVTINRHVHKERQTNKFTRVKNLNHETNKSSGTLDKKKQSKAQLLLLLASLCDYYMVIIIMERFHPFIELLQLLV
ncbi:hypothetical protein DERF_001264 [Dermatophagoides farinae]|uniref:Uncharacterized protein n=1 Tax=Dermatophagoides farinae TaxID=6954 RepID=A0A922IAI2_DERFA|nr:hypothetical protein DERF_001264 [Dermatophagoides farinae]